VYWRNLGNPWGGMHSTVKDTAIFVQSFLNGGVYGGKRILSAATAAAMTTNQNRPPLGPWGLGWALKGSPGHALGELGSARLFGHLGATGTIAWADPEQDLLCVIFTSRALNTDDGLLLRKVSDAVHASLLD
jgi:CubicO group peptidase (beta-lactamase class C family)